MKIKKLAKKVLYANLFVALLSIAQNSRYLICSDSNLKLCFFNFGKY